jgi:hypothetical protein
MPKAYENLLESRMTVVEHRLLRVALQAIYNLLIGRAGSMIDRACTTTVDPSAQLPLSRLEMLGDRSWRTPLTPTRPSGPFEPAEVRGTGSTQWALCFRSVINPARRAPDTANNNISLLFSRLHEARQGLHELTDGSADSVLYPVGQSNVPRMTHESLKTTLAHGQAIIDSGNDENYSRVSRWHGYWLGPRH